MTMADELLLGPRGRRLCLGAAMQADSALWTAVFWLGRELDPNPGTLMRFAEGDGAADDPSFTETDVAAIAARLDPALITDVAARAGLRASVDSAMYWQEPGSTSTPSTPP
ncbi:MAG: hypothetical protein GX871_00875 [Microbacteriaceae bacterium]|jgi:hypothetical protein|nr:hypothetical protein [Microbacteriaceae bacterium]HOA87011.1 hypothetical protein [Microbacteriaceae bacterium]HQC93358.1 hypothetical protein [Microbacteriaceae bacterium]